jgi:hypothetical protein
VHATAAAASSLHVVPVTDDVASAAVNVRLAVLPIELPFVGDVIVTIGGTLSTVKVTVALALPTALVAVTVTVCEPCASPVNDAVDVQAAAAAASSLQVMLVGEFPTVNATGTVVELTYEPFTGELIVTVPPHAQTVKVVEADPTLPAWSVAATVMVWLPGASPL